MRVRTWLLGGMILAGVLQLWVGAQLAYAHARITEGQNPFLVWALDPLVILGIFLAGYLYATGLDRWERPSHPVKIWQRVSFFTGLAAVFLALQSPIDVYSEYLLAVHQLQHTLLRMVGPLLMLLGAPLTPMLRGLPPWALQEVVRPVVRNAFARRAYNFFTNPVAVAFLFLGVMYFWQVPSPHNLALRSHLIHHLMHLTMLLSGLVFWWVIIDPKPHRSRLHYGLRVLYLGLVVIPNTFLGAGLTFAEQVLYSGYGEVGRIAGISPLTDQQIGGLIIWAIGDMMCIGAAGVVMVMWVQQEEAKEQLDAPID